MLVLSVLVLLFVVLITYPTSCESLKCYECSGNKSCGKKETDHIIDCAGKCVSYLNENGNGTIVRRCCSDTCKIENDYKAYFCSKDKCNGIHSDLKLLVMKTKIFKKRIILKREAEEQSPSLSCYDCSAHNPDCATDEKTIVQGCRACLVYHNVYDNNNVIRRCCTSGCGTPDTIVDYEGRTAYSCSSNLCNGIGAENALTNETGSTSTMLSAISSTMTSTTATTTIQTSFSCYECYGSNEQQCTTISSCPMCMVYRNDNDPTKFDRRCCWWNCGSPNQVTDYSGRPTYFCNADKCNGPGSETILGSITTTSTATVTSAITTTTTTQQTSFQCYECSGPDCGKDGSSVSTNCPSCMVYRNPDDQTKIVRRCCWWNCGPSNSVGMHDGLETYFCTGDKCNGYGAESALSALVTTTTTASSTITAGPSITTSSTSSTTQQTSFQCYECSGPDCGKDGSSVSTNCPSCMVYRNPDDQTKIVRRCCWWNCGPSNSVGMHDGLETYFCTGDKCNGYGAESALSALVTTATASTITASVTATSGLTTSSSSSCVLNCQNGGTPETEDGCFCYCSENTNGRECENVDCAQPDSDSEMCSSENQPLCEESEDFALECHHLCGKC